MKKNHKHRGKQGMGKGGMSLVKKLVLILCAFLFLTMGLIGLLLPVIPQVPFFLGAILFLAGASSRFKRAVIKSKVYKKYFQKYAEKDKRLRRFLYEEAS